MFNKIKIDIEVESPSLKKKMSSAMNCISVINLFQRVTLLQFGF